MLDLANTHLRSLVRRGPAQRKAVGVSLVVLVLALGGCTAGDPQFTVAQPAGFWLGLWHGIISVISLVWGVFDQGVEVYERHNNGSWYDFGFLIGITSVWGGGSSVGYHSSRRRRNARLGR